MPDTAPNIIREAGLPPQAPVAGNLPAEANDGARPTSGRIPGWVGWTVIGVGTSVVFALGVLWSNRTAVTQWVIEEQLKDLGAAGTFDVKSLDTNGAALENVVLGDPKTPTLTATKADLSFEWATPFSPRISSITADGIRIALAIQPDGSLDLGALAPLLKGEGGANPVNGAKVAITNSRLALSTPWGLVDTGLSASGVVGERVSGNLALAPTTLTLDGNRLDVRALTGPIALVGENTLEAKLALNAAVTGEGISIPDLKINADLGGSLDGAQGRAALTLVPTNAEMAGIKAGGVGGVVTLAASDWLPRRGAPEGTPYTINAWSVDGALTATSLKGAALELSSVKLDADMSRAGRNAGRGEWALSGENGGFAGHRARSVSLDGTLAASRGRDGTGPLTFAAEADARLARLAVAPAMRASISGGASGLPAPFGDAGKAALDRALASLDVLAPLKVIWNIEQAAGRLEVIGPVQARSQTGAQILWEAGPADPDGTAVLRTTLPDGETSMIGRFTLAGGELPDTNLTLRSLALLSGGTLRLDASAQILPWRVGANTLSTEGIDVLWRGAGSTAQGALKGAINWNGPIAGVVLNQGKIDLNTNLTGIAGGFAASAPQGTCVTLTARSMETAVGVFANPSIPLCGSSGPLLSIRNGVISGGGVIRTPSLSGRTSSGDPIAIAAQTGQLRLSGRTDAPAFDVVLASPTYSQGPAGKVIALRGETFSAAMAGNGVLSGRLDGGIVNMPGDPVNLNALGANWSMTPGKVDRSGAPVIDLTNIALRASDPIRPVRWAPVLVAGNGQLRDGEVTFGGTVTSALGAMVIADVKAVHRLEDTSGEATITGRTLQFVEGRRQPEEIVPALEGVIASTTGAVVVDALATWKGEDLKVSGSTTLTGLNFSTLALGPVKDVSGKIEFDDFLLLTTRPGQVVNVGNINPGIPVSEGRIQFQLLPNLDVAIEDARWPFVGGTLILEPATWKSVAGEQEQRLVFDVVGADLSEFIKLMDFKDLNATGRFEGKLPLVIQGTTATIDGGRLEATNEGGKVQYTGTASDAVAQAGGELAMTALRDFNYSKLVLIVEGPLEGDLVTRIELLGDSIVPIRGVADGSLPFRYNIVVSGPLGRIVRDGMMSVDPRSTFRRLRQETPATPVDVPPANPR
jgi:translocation and assembly module TamB